MRQSTLRIRLSQTLITGAIIGVGAVLAGCGSTSPTTSKGSSTSSMATSTTNPVLGALSSLLGKVNSSSSSSYSVTYTITEAGKTNTGFTYAQDQGGTKAAMSMSDIDIINTGTADYECTAIGGATTCFESTTNSLASLENLFSSKTIAADLTQAESYAGKTVDGYSVKLSTMTVDGQSNQCVNFTEAVENALYCVNNNGILSYLSATGSGGNVVIQLTSFSTNVPSSDFQLPAGATVTQSPA